MNTDRRLRAPTQMHTDVNIAGFAGINKFDAGAVRNSVSLENGICVPWSLSFSEDPQSTSTTTGTWSEGGCQPRVSATTWAALRRASRAGVTHTWSSRRPRLLASQSIAR